MTKENVISEIIELEWEMFVGVNNEGGMAGCQQNKEEFVIMRSSQATTFTLPMLLSYREDLKRAKESNQNLMTIKYARMMESTAPKEYEAIKDRVPKADDAVLEIVNTICAIVMEFESELAEQYPFILKIGRPLYSSEDSPENVSLETYLKCELSTYSLKTLEIYHSDLLKYKECEINPSILIMEHTVKLHGYESLKQANEIVMGKQ